jgi:hypothetical protein
MNATTGRHGISDARLQGLTLNELVHLIRKLRWMGLNDEAAHGTAIGAGLTHRGCAAGTGRHRLTGPDGLSVAAGRGQLRALNGGNVCRRGLAHDPGAPSVRIPATAGRLAGFQSIVEPSSVGP